MMPDSFDHVWNWRTRLPERRGEPCRVTLARYPYAVVVEFADGHRVVASRHAVRRVRAERAIESPASPGAEKGDE